MNILILSCHSVLEYDEFKMFLKMGYNVKSLGAYTTPRNPHVNSRPPIDIDNTITGPKRLLRWADIVICHHRLDLLEQYIKILKYKKLIIYRSIGQCSSETEIKLSQIKSKLPNLKIVRYSPREKFCSNYAGHDHIIRFYKDESEFPSWSGGNNKVITIGQSINERGDACGKKYIDKIKDIKIYSSCNDNRIEYSNLLDILRTSDIFFYTGTVPAPYTLMYIEAAIVGIPIISINKTMFGNKMFEVDELINHNVNGLIANDIDQANKYIEILLQNKNLAKKISKNSRNMAIDTFCSDKILDQWYECLN